MCKKTLRRTAKIPDFLLGLLYSVVCISFEKYLLRIFSKIRYFLVKKCLVFLVKSDILFIEDVFQKEIKKHFVMFQKLSGITESSARATLFLFFGLVFFSIGFFVYADDTVVTRQNIFQDSDQDGLSNDEEVLYKTDPLNKDTDGDGYLDGVEVETGYDPLKPAPGDKLVGTVLDTRSASTAMDSASSENLTNKMSAEIAEMVRSSTDDNTDVTIDSITEAVQNITEKNSQEIVLPEVNVDDIKIKKVSKKLKGDQKKEQEKQDAVEYLTVMAYILANNSPKTFHTENDLSSVVTSLGMDSLTAMTVGNKKYLNDLSKKGEKILSEIKNIEVPEGMLDVHMKAMKMAKYSITLKDEINAKDQSDPLGQIATLSKMQGFFMVLTDFSQEILQKLNDYDIKEIPISL